ncbi:hypothetical protein [Aquipuribacter hungaricus]|uniref:Uncharacterized protein n=1 Tax=Aquipuribacter hungaricus TaxID=545624 RepID=A0ABV7WID9_9MICO
MRRSPRSNSSVAGEEVLRYLGVVSGLLVVVVEMFMLRDAMRDRRTSLGSAVQTPLAVPGADHGLATVTSMSTPRV